MTEVECTIIAVEALEREVNNGGYKQFFGNTPEYAAEIVAALQRIGCSHSSRIAEDAVNALGLHDLSPEAVEEVACRDDDEVDAKLEECDLRFFEYQESIETQLFRYIKTEKHRISF
ncbi:MAG: DUF4375 domain-containing protein [Phycisphaerae bacterium]